MCAKPIITICSDFGWDMSYVGQMKGVIYTIFDDVHIVDITHDIPAWDIPYGSLILEQTLPRFPQGTVHLAIVDPGVGTYRAPVAVETKYGWLVGPDNGLFGFLEKDDIVGIWKLENNKYQLPDPSPTFHGRDIFAPAAAHLAAGVHASHFGKPLEKIMTLSEAPTDTGEDLLVGKVVAIDRFGNLITSIKRQQMEIFTEGLSKDAYMAMVGNRVAAPANTFGEKSPGEPLSYIGSGDRLEIAVNTGSAQAYFSAQPGDDVIVKIVPPKKTA